MVSPTPLLSITNTFLHSLRSSFFLANDYNPSELAATLLEYLLGLRLSEKNGINVKNRLH